MSSPSSHALSSKDTNSDSFMNIETTCESILSSCKKDTNSDSILNVILPPPTSHASSSKDTNSDSFMNIVTTVESKLSSCKKDTSRVRSFLLDCSSEFLFECMDNPKLLIPPRLLEGLIYGTRSYPIDVYKKQLFKALLLETAEGICKGETVSIDVNCEFKSEVQLFKMQHKLGDQHPLPFEYQDFVVIKLYFDDGKFIQSNGLVVGTNKTQTTIDFEMNIATLPECFKSFKSFKATVILRERLRSNFIILENALRFGNEPKNWMECFADVSKFESPLNPMQDLVPLDIPGINPEQKLFIKTAMSLEYKVLGLHGPPGTGKTFTICKLLKQLIQNKESKILVCAPTNTAVDNILKKFANDNEDLKESLIRVGNADRISKDTKDFEFESLVDEIHALHVKDVQKKNITKGFYKSLRTIVLYEENKPITEPIKKNTISTKLLETVKIVFSTLTGTSRIPNDTCFTVLITDEAGQATDLSLLVPIRRLDCERMILCGDHKQLGAFCGSEITKKMGNDISLLERLFLYHKNVDSIVVSLKMQYRMGHDIVKLPNLLFYEGKLETSQTMLRGFTEFHAVNGQEYFDSITKSYSNLDEIQRVIGIVEKSGNSKSIVVITFYKDQQRLLCEKLLCFKTVQVHTVDSFQGSEADIVLVSFVRTKQVGFLAEPKRINVALTRAKEQLHLIGDPNCLWQNELLRQIITCLTSIQ